MIQDIVGKLADRPLEPHAGDYIQSGLIYCGKCKTPRQCKIELLGTTKIVSCMCQCESEDWKAAQAADKEKQELNRIKRLRTAGLQDHKFHYWTFEKDDGSTPQMDKARRYCEKWEEFYKRNIGLLLWGNVGTGKTFFAACIANNLISRNIPVLMTNFIRLTNAMQGFKEDSNAYVRSLDNYKLLIIDDLGVERDSQFVNEKVYDIIDSRYKNGQPLIITTNLSLRQLQQPEKMQNARVFERILEMTVPIAFDGPARRQNIHKAKKQEAAALLMGE